MKVNIRDISDLFSQNHKQHTTQYKTGNVFRLIKPPSGLFLEE